MYTFFWRKFSNNLVMSRERMFFLIAVSLLGFRIKTDLHRTNCKQLSVIEWREKVLLSLHYCTTRHSQPLTNTLELINAHRRATYVQGLDTTTANQQQCRVYLILHAQCVLPCYCFLRNRRFCFKWQFLFLFFSKF